MKKAHDKNRSEKHQEKVVNPYFEKVVKINRVTKVCKGGKRLAFRALVIVGDQKGKVAIRSTKAREVPQAIRQAVEKAKKNLKDVIISNGSVLHEITGRQGAAKVMLKPAPPGTGIIAGGSIRVVLEAAGFKNVVAKSMGSSNALNNAMATLNALLKYRTIEEVAEQRGVKFTVSSVDGNVSKAEVLQEVN